MHIVFTVINDLTNDRRMHRICTTLSDAGHRVTLVGRELPGSAPLCSKDFEQVRLKCHFHKGKFFYIEYQYKLWQYLSKQQFDVYGAVDLDTALPVLRMANRHNKPSVLDLHEYFPEVPEVVHRPIVKSIWEKIEAKTVPYFSTVYTVNQSLANIFSEKYNRPVDVIRNLPEKNAFVQPKKYNPEEFIVLYQGALNEGRGLESLIKSMHDVDGELRLAGEGDLSEKLRTLCRKEKLTEKVKFLGMLSPESLKKETVSATIGVNLLENKGLSYYYSLSNKFFDYMQFAVPQICINFPEYTEIQKQFEIAILIDNFAPQKLAKEINRLKSDAGLYEQLSTNCVRAAQVFNWQSEQEKLVKIFNQLG